MHINNPCIYDISIQVTLTVAWIVLNGCMCRNAFVQKHFKIHLLALTTLIILHLIASARKLRYQWMAFLVTFTKENNCLVKGVQLTLSVTKKTKGIPDLLDFWLHQPTSLGIQLHGHSSNLGTEEPGVLQQAILVVNNFNYYFTYLRTWRKMKRHPYLGVDLCKSWDWDHLILDNSHTEPAAC